MSNPSAGPAAAVKAAQEKPGGILPVLVALAAVIALGQVLAKVCLWFGQPPVIGEILAGILLGPSLIGVHASAWILPDSAAPYLGVVAQLGVILYMFLVGLDLSAERLRGRAHVAALVSHASIVVPFVLGTILALVLYPKLCSRDVPFTSFALFMGVAMSITAFPVLARILTDRGMARSELGTLALSCAAADDATAWCLLALVVGVTRAEPGHGVVVAIGAMAYVAVMLGLIRPVVRRLVSRWDTEHLPRSAVALVFLALLVSALTTEWLGIHALFGAFLLGAVIPRDSTVAKAFTSQLHHITTILLLPAFFAFTGMHTRIDLLSGAEQWLICGAIIVVATIGKFGGTVAAARLTGLGWRESAALGTLMNTRGLMELIVLNVGRDLGVIPQSLFAMLVIMALVTTIATSPIVRRLVPATDVVAKA
ncbi:MAG: cation:proton antiporter [Planctomycetia bacterium]|nr:cation:proton antiporter [Planctomycetia bacterium]